MGRRAKATAAAPARNHSLLGWGTFLGILLGASAAPLAMSVNAGIALAGTCFVVFFVIWFISATHKTSP